MNKKRLLKLAKHLEKVPHKPISTEMNERTFYEYKRDDRVEMRHFNMRTYCQMLDADGCGTTGCIAGHAVALFEGVKNSHEWHFGWAPRAAQALELTPEQAEALFWLPGGPGAWPTVAAVDEAQPHEAARACRRLANGEPLDTLWE